jgi:hypothetical protein
LKSLGFKKKSKAEKSIFRFGTGKTLRRLQNSNRPSRGKGFELKWAANSVRKDEKEERKEGLFEKSRSLID